VSEHLSEEETARAGGLHCLQIPNNIPTVCRMLECCFIMGIRVCDNNALDSDKHSRIDRFSGIVDMGCYEYLPQGTIYSVP